MEVLSQISGWGFSLNKADLAATLDNSSRYSSFQNSLSGENEYYGLSLIKYDQANKNKRLELYTRIVVILIILVLMLNLV